MKKNGLKGTFNINSELYAPEGTVYPEGTIKRRMSKSMAQELCINSGMEVAAHGLTYISGTIAREVVLQILWRVQKAYTYQKEEQKASAINVMSVLFLALTLPLMVLLYQLFMEM